MGSANGSGHGLRRGGRGGGGSDEDEGESWEQVRVRKDNQKMRGKIGRPPNPPRPQPRESPVRIVPRPLAEGERHRSHQRSPSRDVSQANVPKTTGRHVQTSTDVPHIEQALGRSERNRPPRKLTDNLKEDEYLTTVELLSPHGDWVTLPNALVSARWTGTYITPETVDHMQYVPKYLDDAETHTSVTPRGPNRDDKLVGLWMRLQEMEKEKLTVLPILNKRGLGVTIVVGTRFIDGLYDEVTQYVNTEQAATMPIYDVEYAGDYDDYYVQGWGGTHASMNPNVYPEDIEYDLTAVGAGIPVDYNEFSPELISWDGYVQES